MQDPTVAIVRCPDYEQIDEAIDRLLELMGGLGSVIQPGQRVLIKPNLLKADPVESAVITHPAVIRAVTARVKAFGALPFIGDSPAFGTVPKVAKATGIAEIAEELDVPTVDLNRPVSVPTPDARSLPRFKVSRWALEADAIINLPKLKVHQQMQMSGAIKNLFGCVAGKRKAWFHLSHGQDRTRFATMILEYVQLIQPALTITDAVVAMERLGPRNGDPYPLGLLTGGVDVVALDTVHWAILGQSPETLDFLKVARELNMGETRLEHIPTVGLPLEEAIVHDFKMSRQVPVTFSPFRIARSTLKHLWAKRVAAS